MDPRPAAGTRVADVPVPGPPYARPMGSPPEPWPWPVPGVPGEPAAAVPPPPVPPAVQARAVDPRAVAATPWPPADPAAPPAWSTDPHAPGAGRPTPAGSPHPASGGHAPGAGGNRPTRAGDSHPARGVYAPAAAYTSAGPGPYSTPAAPGPAPHPHPTAGVYPAPGPGPYPTPAAPGPAPYPTAGPYPAPGPHPTAGPYPAPSYPAAPQPAARYAPAGWTPPHTAAPGRARRVARWAGEVALLLTCQFSMTVGVAFASEADPGRNPWWLILAWFLGLGAYATIPLRRRYPVVTTVVTGVAALVLPIDALGVLVALPWVIARRPARTAWLCGALTVAATVAALGRDLALGPQHQVLAAVDRDTGVREGLPTLGYVVLGVLLVALSVGAGLLRRSRAVASAASRAHQEQSRAVQELRAELTTELSRQDERDLIARELHDTVAHHLSVVSLRASALEVSAEGDVERDAARSMRSSAHEALEEMRDLIALLRDAQVPLTPGPMAGRTLADLPELLATAREAGADVAATVFVSEGAAAPATLTRAVYRIVQESLTNALKHAPGARIDVDVRAAPGDGVHVRVRNALPGAHEGPAAPGSGTGLVGMRERAATVGGTVTAGPDGPAWAVVAHLPWPAAGSPSGPAPTPDGPTIAG